MADEKRRVRQRQRFSNNYSVGEGGVDVDFSQEYGASVRRVPGTGSIKSEKWGEIVVVCTTFLAFFMLFRMIFGVYNTHKHTTHIFFRLLIKR